MITLTNTTHILEVTTGSATAVDVFVSYADHTSTGAVLGDQQTLITTATTTTVLAAPAASTQRQVKYISVNNTVATTNTVTVKKDISATEYDIFGPVTLGANERLEFLDGRGWAVYANTGALKTSINQGSAAINTSRTAVVLSSDVVNNNATLNTIQDVTGLSFPVTAGHTYQFEFWIPYTAAATTTGSRWSISGPAFTRVAYGSEYSLAATTTTRNPMLVTAYDLPAASNATSSSTTSNLAFIWGVITPSADGNVIARFASEVANSAITALAGAVVYYQEVI